MWNSFFLLLAMSLVMGMASFLAGIVPLSIGLSQHHSHTISLIGTGLLVGTCLIIIIPEGVETLYDASTTHDSIDIGGESGFDGTIERTTLEYNPHAWIGICLILGFIVMYLIDTLPQMAISLTTSRQPMHISLANLSQGLHRAPSPNRAGDPDSADEQERPAFPRTSATTIGLVIHAAADGIALAASSFLARTSTGLVIFLALMIHKAPAAFGLTTILLKEGYSRRLAKTHLIVFSLAAPVAALVTWAIVHIFGTSELTHEHTTKFATGLLLLFSGGTFLYVAMHGMQGSEAEERTHGVEANGYMSNNIYETVRPAEPKARQSPALGDTALIVAGMLLPLLAQVGHAH